MSKAFISLLPAAPSDSPFWQDPEWKTNGGWQPLVVQLYTSLFGVLALLIFHKDRHLVLVTNIKRGIPPIAARHSARAAEQVWLRNSIDP